MLSKVTYKSVQLLWLIVMQWQAYKCICSDPISAYKYIFCIILSSKWYTVHDRQGYPICKVNKAMAKTMMRSKG